MMDMQTAVLVSNLQNIAAWGAIILIGISAFVTAIGFAFLGSKFLESAARQPEIMPQLQVRMFLIAGLLDAIPIISVGVAFLLIFANPLLTQLLKYIG